MIPLPVILVEFMVAFGLALVGGNTLALVRLRRGGAPDGVAPSMTRIWAGIVIGVVVTLWALATWFDHHYHF